MAGVACARAAARDWGSSVFTMGGKVYQNRVAALLHISETVSYGGWLHPVTDLFMPTGSDGGYCRYSNGFRWHMTFEEYKALAPVAQRLRRLHHYLTEVHAGWEVIDRTWYADSSVEVYEVSRYGVTRTRTVVAPSGDLCF